MGRYVKGKDGKFQGSLPDATMQHHFEELELPKLPGQKEVGKASPKDEARIIGAALILAPAIPAMTFTSYLPAGGNPILATGVLALTAVAFIVGSAKILKYFRTKKS